MAVSNHTTLCGLERISLRVATALIQPGERVTIVGESPDSALLREARASEPRSSRAGPPTWHISAGWISGLSDASS